MSSLHNAIRGPGSRIVIGIKRALGQVDAEVGVERFSETLQPVIDPWREPEWAILRGEWLFSFATSSSAVAAQQSKVAVTLGGFATSVRGTHIAVIERCAVSATVAAVRAQWSGNSRTNVAANLVGRSIFASDQRVSPNAGTAAADYVVAPPAIEAWGGAAALSLIQGIQDELSVPLGQTDRFSNLPYIIKPGGAFVVENVDVNEQITVSIAGRVRMALPGELV